MDITGFMYPINFELNHDRFLGIFLSDTLSRFYLSFLFKVEREFISYILLNYIFIYFYIHKMRRFGQNKIKMHKIIHTQNKLRRF